MREHGTHACFVWGPEPGSVRGRGCRCDDCRAANAAYERQRSRWTTPPYVAADEVRRHITFLNEHGVGLKTIAKRSGVAHGTLWKLVYGVPGRGPSKRCRRETRDRILAITPADVADGGKVPAARTLEHVDTLISRGWTRTAIARRLGQTGPGLQLGEQFVSGRNARAVAALLDEPVPPRRSRWGFHPIDEPELEIDDDPAPSHDFDLLLLEFVEILEDRIDQRSWRARAACTLGETKTWVFFPGSGDRHAVEAARKICATCPVAAECAEYATRHRGIPGIWGGLSKNERKAMAAAS